MSIGWAVLLKPEVYGRQRIEVSGPGGGPVQVEAVQRTSRAIMADSELAQAAERLSMELADRLSGN